MKPENQLLVLSARLRLDDQTTRQLKTLLSGTHNPSPLTRAVRPTQNPRPSSVLDWNFILQSAQRLGAAPLLYRHLQIEELSPLVPPHALASLKQAYERQAMQSLRIQAQIRQINQEAASRHIPLIFLKGAALSQCLYQDTALRPMGDIDILCIERDIPKLTVMLNELGYFSKSFEFQSQIHRAIKYEQYHLPAFHIQHGGAFVEVHTNIFGKYTGGRELIEDLWKTAHKLSVHNSQFLFLSPDYMLLHLCLHLQNHMESGIMKLYWLCDLWGYLEIYSKNIDWVSFIDKTKKLNVERAVLQVFKLLNGFTRCASPDKKYKPETICNLSITQLFYPEGACLIKNRYVSEKLYKQLKSVAEIFGLLVAMHWMARSFFPRKLYMVEKYGQRNYIVALGCHWRYNCSLVKKAILSLYLNMKNKILSLSTSSP